MGPFGLGMVTSWMMILPPATGFRMAGKESPFHCISKATDCRYARATGHSVAESATRATSPARPKGKSALFRTSGGDVWTGETNVGALFFQTNPNAEVAVWQGFN